MNRRLAPELYLARRADRRHAARRRASAASRRSSTPSRCASSRRRRASTGGSRRNACRAPRSPSSAPRLARFHAGLPPVRGIAADEIGADGAAQHRRARGATSSRGSRERARDAASLDASARRAASRAMFARRAAAGAHRECHGDLHLQNLLWRDGAIMAFDALEFDRKLRDIDVISEVAFLAMDLHAHGRADLALRVPEPLSRGRRRLRRRRRAALLPRLPRVRPRQGRRDQARAVGGRTGTTPTATSQRRSSSRRRTKPLLVITHGLSGSGKTSVTDELVGRLPALRARSDLERKRLHGLAATARTRLGRSGGGLYAAAATRRTYAALAEIADRLLRNGQNAAHRRDVPAPQRAARVPPGRRRQRGAFRDSRLHGLAGRAAAARRGARARGPRRVGGRSRRPRAPARARRNRSIARNGAHAVTVDTE